MHKERYVFHKITFLVLQLTCVPQQRSKHKLTCDKPQNHKLPHQCYLWFSFLTLNIVFSLLQHNNIHVTIIFLDGVQNFLCFTVKQRGVFKYKEPQHSQKTSTANTHQKFLLYWHILSLNTTFCLFPSPVEEKSNIHVFMKISTIIIITF